jgi:hypothetical protein
LGDVVAVLHALTRHPKEEKAEVSGIDVEEGERDVVWRVV